MGKAIRPYTNCCRIQFLIFCFLLFFDTALLSDDIPIPVNPVEPSVNTTSFELSNQIQDIKVSASISIQGMDEKKHIALFPQRNSVVEVFSSDFPGKRDVKLEDISSFEITRWLGNKEKKGSFIFYPDRYILTLKNGEKINVNKNIPLFNTIRIVSDKGEKILFSCFYDYLKKGQWINRDEKFDRLESTLPVKGCITAFKVN